MFTGMALLAALLPASCRTELAAPTPVGATDRAAAAPGLPPAVVPLGLGVNIHFVEPPPRDVELIAAAGLRFVRMDFFWDRIERRRGEYDFTAYERLVDAFAAREIRPLFILDYGNPLYDNNLAPHTEEGRQAFARFAAAAAARFRGRGVLWELWNEPNVQFWKPRPNPRDYMALAKATLPAMRRADPGAVLVAPAAALFDLAFLERCFEAGLLDLIDAVSVHPYGRVPPERVTADYHRLRVLIARYAPVEHPTRRKDGASWGPRPDAGKERLPILSGEWGYSGTWFSQEQQGDFLARIFLTNLMNEIPLSIWYDWRDDGTDPKEPEHNYGMVTTDYQLKPAYVAARTLTDELRGFRFVKRLALASDEDYALLFARGDAHKVVLWTTSGAHRVTLPIEVPSAMIGGRAKPERAAAGEDGTLRLEVGGRPQYLAPGGFSRHLALEAAWRVETSPVFRADVPDTDPAAPRLSVVVTNPLQAPLRGSVAARVPERIRGRWTRGTRFDLDPGESARLEWRGRFPQREENTFRIPVTLRIDGRPAPMRQEIAWSVLNPLRVRPSLRSDGTLLEVENPAGEPFDGTIRLNPLPGEAGPTGAASRPPAGKRGTAGAPRSTRAALLLRRGERRKAFAPPGLTLHNVLARLSATDRPVTLSGALLARQGARVLADIPPITFRPVEWFRTASRGSAYHAVLEGDANVPARADLRLLPPPSPQPLTPSPRFACRVDYEFSAGWRFARVAPRRRLPIDGQPVAVGMWIYNSTATGDALRCRFTDRTGRTFQPTADAKLTWQGWRWITMRLDDPNMEHWGGSGEEKIHYPILWDSLLLIDSPGHAHQGSVSFTGVTLIYGG